ncbi:MAG: sulfotransferase, partial [Rubrobacteraceae bacterium]
MPDFENRRSSKAARRIKAFLNPDAADSTQKTRDAQTIKRLRRQIASKDEEISRLRASLAGQEGGVKAGNIVWIFGAGRSGSTWLAAMMDELERQTVWFEPRVGVIFDPHKLERYKGKHFVLSEHYKETWLKSIRIFVLEGANARFPEMGAEDYLMTKEPAGSVGATWIMEALPESRMILLVRDPRDYAASWLDAHKEGGWQKERRRKERKRKDWRQGHALLADTDPDAFVERQAEGYVRHVGSAKKAYDAHKGPKTLVRYEDLRA